MSTLNKAEQAVSYAALILADESIAITPEKLQAILKAAGVEDVEPIWTTLFAKALEGKDVKDILTKVAATGPAVGEAGPIKSEAGCRGRSRLYGEDGRREIFGSFDILR
jgi:large subunit ribosomal protein LP1